MVRVAQDEIMIQPVRGAQAVPEPEALVVTILDRLDRVAMMTVRVVDVVSIQIVRHGRVAMMTDQ